MSHQQPSAPAPSQLPTLAQLLPATTTSSDESASATQQQMQPTIDHSWPAAAAAAAGSNSTPHAATTGASASSPFDAAVSMEVDAATPAAAASSHLKRHSADEPAATASDEVQEGDHPSKRLKADAQATQTTDTNQQPNGLAPTSAAAASTSAEESKEIDLPPCTRYPPRHFHAGPWRKQPELYRDALQSIFKFLDREDFPLLTRISKECLDIAAKMPSRGWRFKCSIERELLPVLASPLRNHVTKLVYWTTDADGENHPSIASPALLLLISEKMPGVYCLSCVIEVWPGMLMPRWPSKLEYLKLHMKFDTTSLEEISLLSAMIGRSLVQHAPNLTGLDVRWLRRNASVREHPPEFFEQISEKLELATLRLRGPASTAAFQVVRRMKHLESITLDTTKQFTQLMAGEGSIPPLGSVSLKEGSKEMLLRATEETLPLLLQLSCLRKVDLLFLTDPTPLIPILANLHTLTVAFLPPCDVDLLVAALKHGSSLTSCRIDEDTFTQVHLASILPSMPLLENLEIFSAGVTSLAFLSSAPHLRTTLQHLALSGCTLRPPEIRYLKSLRALEMVVLECCFTSPLDEFTLATLTPGAEGFAKDWWPNLRKMEYMPAEV